MTNDEKHDKTAANNPLALGLSLGPLAGVVLGLLVFDNIGLGLALGMGLGVAIGASADAARKRQAGPEGTQDS
ncbi:hypothetical protein [Streptomyces sp. NPDC059063]|uniref:hypothetical protein n=1 Tax=unclassified Streptomyces TaxID=2593676 RepID=UPI0036A19BFC